MQTEDTDFGRETQRSCAASWQAVEFLRLLDPNGRHNLVSIHPESGAARGQTFEPGAWADMAEWIDSRNERENLYFSVNEPKPETGGKLSKRDIARLRAVCADIDPKGGAEQFASERQRLQGILRDSSECGTPPSIAVDSGNGLQLFWLLAEPLSAEEHGAEIENIGQAIAHELGGDAVHNIDRVMRLPGTINLPTQAKRAKGRKAARASFKALGKGRYSIDELSRRFPPPKSAAAVDGVGNADRVARARRQIDMELVTGAASFDDLAPELSQKFGKAMAVDAALRDLWEHAVNPGEDQTASGRRFALAGRLKCWIPREAMRFDVNEYEALLWVWEHAVNPNEDASDKITEREIARSWGKADPADTIPEAWFDPQPEPERAEERAGAAGTFQWPEPLDIFGDEPPEALATPPAGALPDVIERWSRSEARRKGVPQAFTATAALTVCAAAIGSSLKIRPRMHDDGWTEPACLWSVLVAEPGSAKSPTISAAVKPLREIDTAWRKKGEAERAAWLARENLRKPRERGREAEPRMRRLVVDDATMEKQARIHADNPHGLLRDTDELKSLLGSLGAYKKNADADQGQLLKLYDGSPLTIDRVGSGTISADTALMSLIAGTQPAVIAKLAPALGEDGALQRCLFILDDGKERRGVDEQPDREAVEAYGDLVRGLADAAGLRSGTVHLSAGAYNVLQCIGEDIAALKHVPGASVAWKGHVAKWGKILPRLALTFHAIECWHSFGDVGVISRIPVEQSTAEMAARFSGFLLAHQLRFYQTYYEADERSSNAKWIAGHILAHPEKAKLTRRDVGGAKKDLREPGAMLAAMGELENFGWLRVSKRNGQGPQHWEINPAVHSRFKERAQRERQIREQRRSDIRTAAKARKKIDADGLSERCAYE